GERADREVRPGLEDERRVAGGLVLFEEEDEVERLRAEAVVAPAADVGGAAVEEEGVAEGEERAEGVGRAGRDALAEGEEPAAGDPPGERDRGREREVGGGGEAEAAVLHRAQGGRAGHGGGRAEDEPAV